MRSRARRERVAAPRIGIRPRDPLRLRRTARGGERRWWPLLWSYRRRRWPGGRGPYGPCTNILARSLFKSAVRACEPGIAQRLLAGAAWLLQLCAARWADQVLIVDT